jgi:hypothetical protein
MAKQVLFSIPYNGDLDLIRWAVSTGQVREVYFSGCGKNDYSRRNEKEIKISIKELKELISFCAANRVGRNLLINKSVMFFDDAKEVINSVKTLHGAGGLTGITIADKVLLPILKKTFPGIPIQASANLHIDTAQKVQAAYKMGISEFCLDYSLNRNLCELERIRELKHDLPKLRIKLMANQGCFMNCFYHGRHEDWAALSSVSERFGLKAGTIGALVHSHQCLFQPADMTDIIKRPFIRPEDVYFYEKNGLADTIKIVYRQDKSAILQNKLSAYFSRTYKGDLQDIAPANGCDFRVALVNSLFPKNFIEKVVACKGDCKACGYCESVLKKVVKDKRLVAICGGRLLPHQERVSVNE